MFSLIGIVLKLLIGAFTGYLANMLMKKNTSDMLRNILIGIVGSILGGFIFSLLQLGATGIVGSLIVSLMGSCLLILLMDKLKK